MEVHGTGWLWHANDWAITGAEGQSRTDTGLPPPVFELYWRCASQSLRIWDGVIGFGHLYLGRFFVPFGVA